ncbi:MAG: UDP-3-O-acyl-N-acetylglucosamine deacetylase [Alphaproteobacteria bacterium]
MFNPLQRTIKNEVSCFGIGLHTGLTISMRLKPADIDTGIIFKRTDLGTSDGVIKANYNFVTNTMLGTTIENEAGAKISTVEHLMAALWGCGIDNIIIELNGPEVPIMDGSAEQFVFMIECAHIAEQNKSRQVIEILEKVDLSIGDSYVSVSPAEQFSVSMEIDFNSKVISKQKCFFDSNDFSFKMDLCRARTFGFRHEVETLRAQGLVLGGSLDNAIVVDKDEVLNKGGLRYSDEFVRHKVLDSIGDFYLAGTHIKGHFHGVKSGHSINNKLLRALFANKNAWRMTSLPIQ